MIREYISFFRRCWPLLVFGMMTVFWGNFGQSFFVSWYGTSFQESMNLSAAGYGTAYSIATLTSGLCLMWFGGAIDKIPLRLFVTCGAMGLLTAACLLWQVSSLSGLVIALFLLRFCGQGLLPHTGITTMTRKFAINRGKAMSIAACGVPIGEVTLPSLAVVLIATFGWQRSWLVIGATIPLIFLPISLWLIKQSKQSKYDEETGEASNRTTLAFEDQGSRRTLLKDYKFWLVLPSILASPFIVTGIFIHQGFFLPQMGWTPILFARCFVFYGVSHWLSSLYTGALVDRFSGLKLYKFFLLPMFAGLLLPSLTSGNWTAYGLMIFLGASMGASGPVINALWAEVYGTRHLGAIRAMLSSFAVISSSASPILFGLLIDDGISGQTLFLYLLLYVVIALSMSSFSFSAKQIL